MQTRINRVLKDRSGMTLVSALVVIATVSLSVGILAQVTTVADAANLQAGKISDQLLVRSYFAENADCRCIIQTIQDDSSLCLTGKPFDVFRKDGQLMIGADANSRLGRLRLRGSCSPTTKQFLLETQFMSRSDPESPLLDHLSGRRATWKDPYRGIPPIFSGPPTGMHGVLDFESIPGVRAGLTVDQTVNEYFRTHYGVTFRYLGSAKMKIARIAYAGESRPAFEAWWSANCPSKPNRNQLCAGKAVRQEAKRYALSSSNATDSKSINFEVIYDRPALNPSFDIFDFDGKETWRITAYDVNNNMVSSQKFHANKRYSTKGTGNSNILSVSVDSGTTPIHRLEFNGRKGIKIFGFAFDNFKTGIANDCQITQ